MKTKIIIYSLLFLMLAGIAYLVLARRQAPIGLATGEIKSYTIVRKDIYGGRPAGPLYNDKGIVFVVRTTDRITIVQTDNNGKKIFTIKEGLMDMNAVFSDACLATNPSGSGLCIAWLEKLDKVTKLYYKFYDIESGNPAEAVKIDEVNGLSYINLFYNNEYDEFAVFYLDKDEPRLVAIDSLGYNKSSIDLEFKFIPKVMDMICNVDERLYAVITHKDADNYRLIQFDSNGNLIADNDLIIENVSNPVNISIHYYSVNTGYNIFISQENTLYFAAIDNRGYVLDVKKKIVPFNFKSEFDIADNGQGYDLVYFGALQEPMIRIFYTSISYEGTCSNKYNKLVDFKGDEESHSPMVVFSNDNINILCIAEGLNTVSILGSSTTVKATDYEAQSEQEESDMDQSPTQEATEDTDSTADDQISETEEAPESEPEESDMDQYIPEGEDTEDTDSTADDQISDTEEVSQLESEESDMDQYIPEGEATEDTASTADDRISETEEVPQSEPEEISSEPQISEESPESPSQDMEEPEVSEELERLEDIMKYQPVEEPIPEITPERIMASHTLKPIGTEQVDTGFDGQLRLKQIMSYTDKDIPKTIPVKVVPVPEEVHKPNFAEIYKRWLREVINRIVDKLEKLKYRKSSSNKGGAS